MHEALGMAAWLREQLKTQCVLDDGAQYSIVVTDAAGNTAEVEWTETYGWMWDEGVNLPRLKTRLRMEEETG